MYKLLAYPTKIKRVDGGMVAQITTAAFLGVDAVSVDVKAHLAPGPNAFTKVDLPDKSAA